MQGQIESPKGNDQDQFAILLESIKGLDKKLEDKFSSMERIMHQFELTNIEAQVKFEDKINKRIKEQKTDHEKRTNYIESVILNIDEKVDAGLAERQHRIITSEKGLGDRTIQLHEVLKNRIKDSERVNKEKFNELEKKQETLKIDIGGEIRNLKHKQYSVMNNNGDGARLIYKQIRMPVYHGRS